MMRLDVTKSSFLSTLLLGCGLLATTRATAEESCSVRGEAVMPRGVSLYDAPSGGQELAQFTGGKVDLVVSSFPEAAGGRAGISTSGFRIKGFVRARDLPLYTVRSVPVYAGHVWIADGRKVSIIGASGGRLHVEKTLAFPMTGYLHGWAPCDAFTLAPRVPSGWSPPGGARGHLVKKERIDLYSDMKGDVVTSIEPSSDGPGVLLWSTERTGAWLHVEHHGDAVLDGWVRAQDVSTLPPGETMDQVAPSTFQPGSPQLQVQGQAKVVRVPHELSIRAAASDAALPIGAVDGGVDVMVLDVVAGWASVLPKNLVLAPVGTTQFWVKAKELGL